MASTNREVDAQTRGAFRPVLPISSVARLWETRTLRWGRRRINLNVTDQRPLACLASRAGRPIVTGVPLLTCFASSRASQLVSRMQP